ENPAAEDMVFPKAADSMQYEEIPLLQLAGGHPEIELSGSESRSEDRAEQAGAPGQAPELAPDPELETPLEWGTEMLAQVSSLESTRVPWGEPVAAESVATKPVPPDSLADSAF